MALELSDKQRRVFTWWMPGSPDRDKTGVICDGAVRSGKTWAMSLSFALWAMTCFDGAYFGLCGKTEKSLRRNLSDRLQTRLRALGFTVRESKTASFFTVALGRRTNRFYTFGGRDAGAASLIQGVTLAGVLLDECALMPQEFVQQAVARVSVPGSRLWFNCNPEGENHPFKLEWIDKAEAKGLLRLTFTMADNPALTPEIRARYERMYTGAFYERFVLGRWVSTSGLVYPFFGPRNVSFCPGTPQEYYISCDYGTVNPMSMGLWGRVGGVWYRLREYYHDGRKTGVQKTDEEYCDALETLAGDCPIRAVIVDPSAASFIACLRRRGRFRVIPAVNQVADGIRRTAALLQQGKLRICPNCTDILREFTLYRWDERRDETPRKRDDHAMDDMRYFVQTVAACDHAGIAVATPERKEN